jgi:uncharacterized protein
LSDLIALLLAGLAVFIAGIPRGFAGFGGPLIMMPVMSLLYGPTSAVVTTLLIDYAGNLRLLPETIREISWTKASSLIVGTALTIPLGAYALVVIDPAVMKRIVSAHVIVFVLILFSGWHYKSRLTLPRTFFVGALAGFVRSATSLGITVPLFFLTIKQGSANTRAYSIVWGFFATTLALGSLAVSGSVTKSELTRAIVLTPVYLLSIFYGRYLLRGIREEVFRRVVLSLLLAISSINLFL